MPVDGVLTGQEWNDLVISIAALRGAEITPNTMVLLPEGRVTITYYAVSGCGFYHSGYSLAGICRDWLEDIGIHVSSTGEIADLSTRIEDTEGADGA